MLYIHIDIFFFRKLKKEFKNLKYRLKIIIEYVFTEKKVNFENNKDRYKTIVKKSK